MGFSVLTTIPVQVLVELNWIVCHWPFRERHPMSILQLKLIAKRCSLLFNAEMDFQTIWLVQAYVVWKSSHTNLMSDTNCFLYLMRTLKEGAIEHIGNKRENETRISSNNLPSQVLSSNLPTLVFTMISMWIGAKMQLTCSEHCFELILN